MDDRNTHRNINVNIGEYIARIFPIASTPSEDRKKKEPSKGHSQRIRAQRVKRKGHKNHGNSRKKAGSKPGHSNPRDGN